MPIPGCNCPKCTNLRKYNNQEKPIPKPIIPLRVINPISSNNNLFNSSNEMPIPGCNCPKCTNLRRYNNQVKPISKSIIPLRVISPISSNNNLFIICLILPMKSLYLDVIVLNVLI